jgi:hypothetical protein
MTGFHGRGQRGEDIDHVWLQHGNRISVMVVSGGCGRRPAVLEAETEGHDGARRHQDALKSGNMSEP